MNFLRRSTLAAIALLALVPAAAATDIVVKNDSLVDGSQGALQGGFILNETGAAVLDAPGSYPLTLKDIQVLVLKSPLFAQTTMSVKLYVWNTSTISGSSPSLASAIYTSPTITFVAGGFNIWDVSASNIVVTGPFTVGCQIISSGGFGGFLSPSLVTDADGCQNGKNWVRQTNGVWANLCSFGVSGDLAFRVTASTAGNTGQFINVGHALAGSFAPVLAGSGSLVGGASFTLAFTGMPPSTSGPLFAGLTAISVPFKSGTLVPSPDIIISLATGAGSLNLPASMPPGLPGGTQFFLQAWFPDAGAPAGADATNALKLITP
jgi:hypothetical protein